MGELDYNSLALTFLTLVLALFTGLLWWETKRSRLQSITPQISIYFYPITPTAIGMKIENTSQADARNVVITCLNKNKYIAKGGREIFYSDRLSKKFSYLPSHQSFSFYVGLYGVMGKECFEFSVTFRDISDKHEIAYPISINVSQLKMSLFEKRSAENVAENLKKLNGYISSIIENDDGRGLRVYTYSQEDRRINRLKRDNDFYRWQLEEREE